MDLKMKKEKHMDLKIKKEKQMDLKLKKGKTDGFKDKKVSKKQDGGLKDWIPKYERTMFEQINPRKSLLSGFYHIRTINNKSNIEREKIFQKIFIDILMKKALFKIQSNHTLAEMAYGVLRKGLSFNSKPKIIVVIYKIEIVKIKNIDLES